MWRDRNGGSSKEAFLHIVRDFALRYLWMKIRSKPTSPFKGNQFVLLSFTFWNVFIFFMHFSFLISLKNKKHSQVENYSYII
jgi:hypothetical protein